MGKAAPVELSRPTDAVAHEHIAYFRNYRTKSIYMYNLITNEW